MCDRAPVMKNWKNQIVMDAGGLNLESTMTWGVQKLNWTQDWLEEVKGKVEAPELLQTGVSVAHTLKKHQGSGN